MILFMAQQETGGDSRPQIPYTSFVTFMNQLDRLEEHGIPGKVDPSVFPNLAGGTTSHLLAALRFFGAIDEAGTPQPVLRQLVDKGTRKEALERLVVERYAPIFSILDLSKASPSQLDEAIRSYNITGATHRKAKTFFLQATDYVGMPISNHLKAKGSRGAPGKPNGQPRKRRSQRIQHDADAQGGQGPTADMRTIELPSVGGQLTLTGTFNAFELAGEERELIFKIVDLMAGYERKARKGGQDDD